MFWKKKENPTTKMYKRIERLYSIMEYLQMEKFYTISGFGYQCEYKTNLGKRRFSIIPQKIYCDCGVEIDRYFKVDFCERIELKSIFLPFTIQEIFSLDVYENETKIQPCPIELTAHEIDLAILEFENYIDKIYNEHKAKQDELSK